jgi:hypothetical protein
MGYAVDALPKPALREVHCAFRSARLAVSQYYFIAFSNSNIQGNQVDLKKLVKKFALPGMAKAPCGLVGSIPAERTIKYKEYEIND